LEGGKRGEREDRECAGKERYRTASRQKKGKKKQKQKRRLCTQNTKISSKIYRFSACNTARTGHRGEGKNTDTEKGQKDPDRSKKK